MRVCRDKQLEISRWKSTIVVKRKIWEKYVETEYRFRLNKIGGYHNMRKGYDFSKLQGATANRSWLMSMDYIDRSDLESDRSGK